MFFRLQPSVIYVNGNENGNEKITKNGNETERATNYKLLLQLLLL